MTLVNVTAPQTPAEQEANPRSASVRLRAAERLRPTPDHLREHEGWAA